MNRAFPSTIRSGRSTALFVAVAALLMVCPPSSMHGQSVDYGALEQLFKEPVTTSVTGSPQRVSDVPATMEIITAEDIRRSGAKDIPGVLRHMGGVDTLEWGNDDIDVSVRGYDQAYSPRLLVFLDGRQVYADDYGYVAWSTVPVELDAIRQIEVIKGPNSALFGFNAAGGVINIVTFNPLYHKVNKVSVTGGSQDLGKGSIVATSQFGERAGVRVSAGGDYDRDFSTLIPPAVYLIPRIREYRAALDLDGIIRLSDKVQLSMEGSWSLARQNEMLPGYQIYETKYNVFSVKTQLKAESRIGLLQATAYTNWLRMTGDPGEANQPFHPRNRVTVVQLDDVFQPALYHTLRVAAEYRHNTEQTTPYVGGDVFYNVFAMSGMWDWKILPSLSLTIALRGDHLLLGRSGSVPGGYPFSNSDWNRSITQPSFNGGLVWKATDTDSLRLTVSRGSELPSLILNGAYLVNETGYSVTGSPHLNPSVVTNYEIGWEHEMPRRHILFRGSAFDQTSASLQADYGGDIVTATGFYAVPANVGSSDARGLELGLRGAQLANFRWSLDYRPEWITDQLVSSAQNGAEFIDYQHTTPVHLVKANLGWANKRWELDGYLHYQSQMHGLHANGVGADLVPVGGFVSLDGRVAYDLTSRVTWSVSGQNLTHASQIQTSGPAVERRVLGTMSFHF
jgi:outer membrane receptor for ferrienterochelin and colicins